MTTLWLAMFGVAVGLVVLDPWLLRPLRRRVDAAGSVGYGAFYLVLGMAFNLVVYFVYDRHWLGAGLEKGYGLVAENPGLWRVIDGPEATLQYLAAFVVAIVLGLDSAFVMAAVLAHTRIKERHQHRMLMWGVLPAIVVRFALVFGFGELIHRFEWFRFVLAIVLLLAAIRMVIVRKENVDPDRNLLVRVLRSALPIGRRRGGSLVSQEGGRTVLSGLIGPLIVMETADAFLAFDAIPAGYAFTREPWLIFCAGCFALLCVRSMAPALMAMLQRLRYFKLGLAVILVYTAIMIARRVSGVQDVLASANVRSGEVHMLWKLAFVGAAILIGVLAAAITGAPSHAAGETVSPLGEDADRIARSTLATARKVGVGVLGVTGLALGAFMAVGPGPGIPVLLGSLLLLATEFAIAKRLVDKYRHRAEAATFAAAEQTRRRMRPWTLAALALVTCGGGVLVHLYGHVVVNAVARPLIGHAVLHAPVPPGLIISAVVPMLAGQALIGYLAFVHPRQGKGPDA